MNNIDRAAEVLWENAGRPIFGTSVAEHAGWDDLSGTARLPFTSAAAALAKAGLLAPEPRIIRTRAELAALDPDTVLLDVDEPRYETRMSAREWMEDDTIHVEGIFPLAVLATGEQVRAARQALEESS